MEVEKSVSHVTFASLLIHRVEVTEDIPGYDLFIRETFEYNDQLLLSHCTHAFGGETPTDSVHTAVHCNGEKQL